MRVLYNQALLEDKSEEHRLLKPRNGSRLNMCLPHHEVEELELQGFWIINGLLDFYRPLLMMPQADFADLVRENFHKHYFIETRLLQAVTQAAGGFTGKLLPHWQINRRKSRPSRNFITAPADSGLYQRYDRPLRLRRIPAFLRLSVSC